MPMPSRPGERVTADAFAPGHVSGLPVPDLPEMDRLDRTVRALSAPARREILWLVWDHELPAGRIASVTGLAAATVSEHLASLMRAGLIEQRRDRNYRWYRARRDRLRGLQSLVMDEGVKWRPSGLADSTAHVNATIGSAVTATLDVGKSVEQAFDDFNDGERYGAWLGVPVSLVDGQFSCTMESGLVVRGTYEVVVRPRLIAMLWDFSPFEVPVPGSQLPAWLRFEPCPAGCRLTLYQPAPDDRAAGRLARIWSVVFGRFALAANDNCIAPADVGRQPPA
jgi:ArsR family transcriptional regulator, arsenate/arsenite/antimonite-responsive transcriptional repressor